MNPGTYTINYACCPTCSTPVPAEQCNTDHFFACSRCSSQLIADIFPALYREHQAGARGESIVDTADASCFYHPQKKAAVVCSSCGRFLCQLCEIDHAGSSICPVCLQNGRDKEDIQTLVTQRTLHDNIALAVSVLPIISIILVYFTLFTAPLALFLALRAWKKPLSILPRTRVRFILAILLSLLQIVAWVFAFILLFN
jgi:hypothetical protein